MVFAYNKNMGWQEYDSMDEAKESIQTKQLILRDGVTYVKLSKVEGIKIFVCILTENLEDVDDSLYTWSMKNKWLQSEILPYAKRILRTTSKNNCIWKIKFTNGYIVSVEQLVTKPLKNRVWHSIKDDVFGIFQTSKGHFTYMCNTDDGYTYSVGTVFSLKTAVRLKRYYLRCGCPDWMVARTKKRYFSKAIDELFSDSARKWDASFDEDVIAVYDSQYDEIHEKEICSLDSLIHVEDVEDVASEEVTLCSDTDECDLILRVLRDLQELDKTSFRHKLEYGNLKTELSRIYGEIQVQKIIGGAI